MFVTQNAPAGITVGAVVAIGRIGQNQINAAIGKFIQEAQAAALFNINHHEFHAATSLAFADLLSELRKYGVALAASTQFSSRIEPVVHEAILGNVGSLIVFRVGATDAAIPSRQLAAETPQPRDLVNLPNYEAFMKLMVDGRQERVFSAQTTATYP